ncbi:hypothetical protein CR513_43036, partial [Mucuna pruriens]
MDSKSSSQESKEVARESLIAISNSLPDKILDSNSVSESKKPDGVAMPNCDQDDKFRFAEEVRWQKHGACLGAPMDGQLSH